MSLTLTIKSSDIAKDIEQKIKKKIEADLIKAVETLANGAAKHAEKLAKERMPKSLGNIYTNNIYVEQISDNIMEVGIRKEAYWLENGRKGGFMEELLNRKSGSEVKTDKEGNRYRVIPFEHSTGTKDMSSSSDSQDLIKELKGFLKSKGVNYSKTRGLSLDESGSPRIGKTHSFSIKDMRGKRKNAKDLSQNLQGVSVHQSLNEKTGRIERNIMTFRVISEKHKGSKWEHPGRPGEKILEDVYRWVEDTWRKDILPSLKDKYESKS